MKKKLYIFVGLALLALIVGLRIVPIYSKSVEGCKSNDMTVHKSMLFGGTKSEIDKESQEFINYSNQFDCPISTITYKLTIL